MGYQQDLRRNFSLWSVLGVAFSLTNSWFGVSASMVTGINSGGPVLLIYGIVLIALITSCAAISLSELVSMMPNAAGQSFWTAELASPRYAKFAGYSTGCFAWVGSIFTTSSVALAMATAIVGLYQLTHAAFEVKAWHVIVVYQGKSDILALREVNAPISDVPFTQSEYFRRRSFMIGEIVPDRARSHIRAVHNAKDIRISSKTPDALSCTLRNILPRVGFETLGTCSKVYPSSAAPNDASHSPLKQFID